MYVKIDSNNISRSLEQFFLTVGQNNFGNKIPFLFFFGIKPVISKQFNPNAVKIRSHLRLQTFGSIKAKAS